MNLENFTTYYFRIRASDWTNYVSTWSEVKSGYPYDTTPPAKITTLQAARADGVEVRSPGSRRAIPTGKGI